MAADAHRFYSFPRISMIFTPFTIISGANESFRVPGVSGPPALLGRLQSYRLTCIASNVSVRVRRDRRRPARSSGWMESRERVSNYLRARPMSLARDRRSERLRWAVPLSSRFDAVPRRRGRRVELPLCRKGALGRGSRQRALPAKL